MFRLKVRYVLQHQVLAKWPPKDGTVYSTPYTLPDQSSSTTTTTEQSISPEASTSAPQQEGDNENEDTLSYSLVSSDGVYTAEAGDSHTANYSMNSPYSVVYWYVTTPAGIGSNVDTENGDGSKTNSSLNYTFPSGVSGEYRIAAIVYDNNGTTAYEPSYTVTVSLPTTTETTTPAAPVVVPIWSDIPDPYNLTVGDSFYLDLNSYVTGSPTLTRRRNGSRDGGIHSWLLGW